MVLNEKHINLLIVTAAGLAVYTFYKKGGAVIDAGQSIVKPLTDPIGKAIADLRYGAAGSGVQATESYIVIRGRDFNQFGQMSESAYSAAIGMHSLNSRILQTVLTVGRRLQEPYLSAIKQGDFIVLLSGEIQYL